MREIRIGNLNVEGLMLCKVYCGISDCFMMKSSKNRVFADRRNYE